MFSVKECGDEQATARFAHCSRRSEDLRSLAKCVSLLIARTVPGRPAESAAFMQAKEEPKEAQKVSSSGETSQHHLTKDPLRRRREAAASTMRRSQPPTAYNLLSSHDGLSPLGGVAKLLTRMVLATKQKTTTTR